MTLSDEQIIEHALIANEKRLDSIRAGIADVSVSVSGCSLLDNYQILNMTQEEWKEEVKRFRKWVDGRIK